MRSFLILLFLCLFQFSYGWYEFEYSESNQRTDYCIKLKSAKKRIGEKIKIYHVGGIYSNVNQTDLIKWPNKEVKAKAGSNYWKEFKPKAGDIGEIKYVVKSKYKQLIYILLIDGYFVPIECGYLVAENELDVTEVEEKSWQKVIDYGKGDCNFKKHGLNDVWNRAGITEMDKISEAFACELKDKGISDILLIKQINDRNYSAGEKMHVLWKEKDKGYIKSFENNKKFKPKSLDFREFEWDDLLKFYHEKNVSDATKKPKSIVSHYSYTVAQLYSKNQFYSFGMQLLCSEEDEKLVNVQFIREIERKLK